VDLIKCRGCGTCAAICPSKAIELTYFRDDQFMALVDELLPMGE
jgi:heterodisulfide reductase subunit A